MCNDKHNNEETKSRLQICIIIIAIIGVIALWGLSWWGINKYIDEPTNRGTFGDMFGAVNALFSGLAFAGLITTLLYQRDELKLQRKELSLTRQELNAQKLEFQEQNKTFKCQRFENTFFNMLSLQQEIISSLFLECSKFNEANNFFGNCKIIECKGRDAFRIIYLEAQIKDANNNYYEGLHEYLKNINIDDCFNDNIVIFNHYFRNLYQLYKLVDTSELITDNKRYDYVQIISNLLSEYELVMLFYYCLATNDQEDFKSLIEKYSIFNNLRLDLLANISHRKEYAEKAYNQYEK